MAGTGDDCGRRRRSRQQQAPVIEMKQHAHARARAHHARTATHHDHPRIRTPHATRAPPRARARTSSHARACGSDQQQKDDEIIERGGEEHRGDGVEGCPATPRARVNVSMCACAGDEDWVQRARVPSRGFESRVRGLAATPTGGPRRFFGRRRPPVGGGGGLTASWPSVHAPTAQHLPLSARPSVEDSRCAASAPAREPCKQKASSGSRSCIPREGSVAPLRWRVAAKRLEEAREQR